MNRIIKLFLSLAISAVLFWASLRNTDVRAVWAAIVHAHLVPIVEYLAILVAIHFIRTIRWGVLLEPLVKPKFRDLNPLSAVGIMALMVLPLRLGEFARPLLAAEYLSVKRSAALASIVVERIIDGLCMALVLVALLYSIPAGPNVIYYRTGGALVALGWAVGLAALIIGVWQHERAVGILHATVGRFAPKIATRIETMLDAFIAGLKVLPSVGKAVWFFALTGMYWFLAGWGLAVLAPAFGTLHFTTAQAFTVLGMQVIGAMIPAGPGMVGTFQYFTLLGVGFFGVATGLKPEIVAFANTVWFMQFTQQSAFGLWFIGNGRVRPGAVFSGLTSFGSAAEQPAPETVAERTAVGESEAA